MKKNNLLRYSIVVALAGFIFGFDTVVISGANMENWIKVLDQIVKKGDNDTLYIFGHSLNPGEETDNAEDLVKLQDYLDKVLTFAEAEYKKGVSKEEFIKNTSIPGVTEWSGGGIERPLTAAYEEVAARQ